jgi:hypothetical protein
LYRGTGNKGCDCDERKKIYISSQGEEIIPPYYNTHIMCGISKNMRKIVSGLNKK